MRIGIDAHHVNGKPQGSRTYLLELIRALPPISDDELLVYSFRPEETRKLLPEPRLEHHRVFPRSARLRLPFVVPLLELSHRLDVFHSQYIAPPVSFVPEVVTIHDVLFETHPHLFGGAFSRRSVELIRRSARRARVVLTVSEFSRSAILDCYRLAPEKVLVTPNAVDHDSFRPLERAEIDASVRKRYGLTRPFVLSVGRIEPRKNLLRLLHAFSRVRERLGSELALVLAGAPDFGSEEVLAEARRLPEGAVILLGAVPDADLPLLYNLSEALAYPSLVEGFGMPVLEAMACGVPVLTSSRGALPEVGRDSVLAVDPEDEDAIEDGLERVLTDVDLRRTLAAAGPRKAREFTWANTARGTLQAYRMAAG